MVLTPEQEATEASSRGPAPHKAKVKLPGLAVKLVTEGQRFTVMGMQARSVFNISAWMRSVRESSAEVLRSLRGRNSATGSHELLVDEFADAASLRASQWAPYFEKIYGIDSMRFPFALRDLSFFHFDLLPPAIARSLQLHSQHVPTGAAGSHYFMAVDSGLPIEHRELYGHVPYQKFDLATVPHRALRSALNVWRCIYPFCSGEPPALDLPTAHHLSRGLPSHARVEVYHTCCDPERVWPTGTAWFYLAVGSGVYLDLRRACVRTLVLRHHRDVGTLDPTLCCFSPDNVPCNNKLVGHHKHCFSRVAEVIRKAGYDTVQFTNYNSEHYADYEIWDVATGMSMPQRGPCLEGITPGMLTRGWAGLGGDCACQPSGGLSLPANLSQSMQGFICR